MKYVSIAEDPQSLVFDTPLNLSAIIGLFILKVHGYTNEQLLPPWIEQSILYLKDYNF